MRISRIKKLKESKIKIRKNPRKYEDEFAYVYYTLNENPQLTELYASDNLGLIIWRGSGNEFLSFLTKMFTRKSEKEKYISQKIYEMLNEEPYELIRKNLIYSIQNDDFYEITGGIKGWVKNYDVENYIKELYSKAVLEFEPSREQINRFWKEINYDYEDFLDWFKETIHYEKLVKDLTNAKSLDELKEIITEFYKYKKDLVLIDYAKEKVYETFEKIM